MIFRIGVSKGDSSILLTITDSDRIDISILSNSTPTLCSVNRVRGVIKDVSEEIVKNRINIKTARANLSSFVCKNEIGCIHRVRSAIWSSMSDIEKIDTGGVNTKASFPENYDGIAMYFDVGAEHYIVILNLFRKSDFSMSEAM
eukprot:scaffold1453_cov140-Skeletonema_menzelii.AAC.3